MGLCLMSKILPISSRMILFRSGGKYSLYASMLLGSNANRASDLDSLNECNLRGNS